MNYSKIQSSSNKHKTLPWFSGGFSRWVSLLVVVSCVVVPVAPVFAEDALDRIYAKRGDLQVAFDATTKRAIAGTASGFLLDLEDWARQYGWMEHPELAMYAPKTGDGVPVRVQPLEIESHIGAQAYVVMDRSTGKILTVKNENKVWPIASLTKLVTASVVRDEEVSLSTLADVRTIDNVGGARLYVEDGDTFSVQDLFYATLVASANNAANALSRTTNLSREAFLERMNLQAKVLGLTKTKFVDPTGIELENVSTAREMARLAGVILDRDDLRKFTQTASRKIQVVSQGTSKTMTNTNWMLWKPEYDDVYVTGGKTGYLVESGWNLVVSLRPMDGDPDTELLIVLFGAESRDASFKDANALADWAWSTHEWQKQQ